MALVRAQLQKPRAFARVEGVSAPKRPRVLIGGLAMRAARRGLSGGRGRELDKCLDVGRGFRVMCEPSGVGAGRPEHLQRLTVELEASVWTDRLFDRDPRELVSELDTVATADQHPRGEALVQDGDVPACECFQSGSSARGGTTETTSRIPRASGRSPEARAVTASRTVCGTSETRLARTSVTKNGLPAVRWKSSSGSTPYGAASSRTASRERFALEQKRR
jgi:hypothetical protein